MNTLEPFDVLGESLAAAISGKALSDVLADLILDLSVILDVHAIGIIGRTGKGEFELLSATSHRVAELEMYQAALEEGPCIDCLRTGTKLIEAGDAITRLWPTAGAAVVAAGFRTVMALPMLWRAEPMAGLNLFWRQVRRPSPKEVHIAETFAAAATLMLGQTSSEQRVTGNVVSVLHERTIVEQAKGALAYEHGLDMEAAFDELRRRARDEGEDVAEVARTIVTSYASLPRDQE